MPSESQQPPPHVELLQECIETFDDLEIVLALLRHSDRSATITELSSELRLAESDVVASVDRLAGTGLVRSLPPVVRLDAGNPRRVLGLQALQREYAANRTRIMSLMTDNALHRVRTSALRAFARAFVLRKKDDG